MTPDHSLSRHSGEGRNPVVEQTLAQEWQLVHSAGNFYVFSPDGRPPALTALLIRRGDELTSVRPEPDETTLHSTKPANWQVAAYVEHDEFVHISTNSIRTDCKHSQVVSMILDSGLRRNDAVVFMTDDGQ